MEKWDSRGGERRDLEKKCKCHKFHPKTNLHTKKPGGKVREEGDLCKKFHPNRKVFKIMEKIKDELTDLENPCYSLTTASLRLHNFISKNFDMEFE